MEKCVLSLPQALLGDWHWGGAPHFLWQVLVGYRTTSLGPSAPVHLPIAYSLLIFSSQTLTS